MAEQLRTNCVTAPKPQPEGANTDNEKILLVTHCIEHAPTGGRQLLCKLNYEILRDLFGEQLILYEIPKTKLQGWKSIARAFSGHIDGLNDELIERALHILHTQNINRVFVDGSGFGGFVKKARQAFPATTISTFFHNVEAKFFLGALRDTKTVRALATLLANYLAERKSVRYSDQVICLSERDSQSLQALYGRRATHISALAMADNASAQPRDETTESAGQYALFVGGGFYANRAGIEWFVERVAPRIRIQTCIVGRGLDDMKVRLEHNEKVVFIGAVEHLEEWYRQALFTIAPIFDGSGMKTKVAEALMFGKKVVGTREAFSGYEGVLDHAGWECNTADDFVAAINLAQERIVNAYDPVLRLMYEERYSFFAARARFADILNVIQ